MSIRTVLVLDLGTLEHDLVYRGGVSLYSYSYPFTPRKTVNVSQSYPPLLAIPLPPSKCVMMPSICVKILGYFLSLW